MALVMDWLLWMGLGGGGGGGGGDGGGGTYSVGCLAGDI
jgi:hypothetical protein